MRNSGRARTEQAPAPFASKVKQPAKWEKGTVSPTGSMIRSITTEIKAVITKKVVARNPKCKPGRFQLDGYLALPFSAVWPCSIRTEVRFSLGADGYLVYVVEASISSPPPTYPQRELAIGCRLKYIEFE